MTADTTMTRRRVRRGLMAVAAAIAVAAPAVVVGGGQRTAARGPDRQVVRPGERERPVVPDECVIATVDGATLTVHEAREMGASVRPAPPLDALIRLTVDVAVASVWARGLAQPATGHDAYRRFIGTEGGAGTATERARRLQARMRELRGELGVQLGPCYPAHEPPPEAR